MAPEIIEGKYYSGEAADLFSAAVTLFNMMTGACPFDDAIEEDANYSLLINHDYAAFWNSFSSKGESYSDDFKDLIQKMFAYSPRERLSLEEVKEHPWLHGPIEELAPEAAFSSHNY